MERQFKIFRYILYGIELVVLFIFQGTPSLIPELFGGKPSLLLPAVLTIAMFEPKIPALLFGLAGGLLTDISGGGVIGFFALLMTIFCYIASHLTTEIIRSTLLTAMLLSFIAIPIALVLHFLFFYVFFGYGEIGYFFMNHYLSRIVYTVALTPIAYYVNKTLALKINVQ